jgi:sialic acid synthase SpsE
MTKIYANISIDHQQRYSVLEQRIVAAAQCNADAVILTKSNPVRIIPEEKKYVPVESRWGTIPYIDFARKSEVTPELATTIHTLCKNIGITLIWCVTDVESASFVKEFCDSEIIKIHNDAVDMHDVSQFCFNNFSHVIYPASISSTVISWYNFSNRMNFSVCHTPESTRLEDLKLNSIDELKKRYLNVGYESRYSGIFPCIATAFKDVSFIEKYLGDSDSNNDTVLSPDIFYELFRNLEILGTANGQQD